MPSHPDNGKLVRVVVDVRIDDAEKLRAYATKRYAACWFNDTFIAEADDVAIDVREALVASNENPSPNDYGIDIVDIAAEVVE